MSTPTLTYWGSPAGDFAVELRDGLVVDLRVPARLVDPVHGEELAEELVAHLNDAFAKHVDEFLETADPNPLYDR